jgi:hypothetical protein
MHIELVSGAPLIQIHSPSASLIVKHATIHVPAIDLRSLISPTPTRGEDRGIYIEIEYVNEQGNTFTGQLRFAMDGFHEEVMETSTGRITHSFWHQMN